MIKGDLRVNLYVFAISMDFFIGDPIVQCDNQPEDTRTPLVTGKAPMCVKHIATNF
jgi:hypothetical protein